MPLKVLGAGFGRTGTLSLQNALEILGFPCYHMTVFMFHEFWDFPDWLRVVASRSGTEKLKHLAHIFGPKKYTATVDFPSCLYVKELLELYPEAKVILTVRDAEKWYESVNSTISLPAKLEFDCRQAWWGPFVRLVRLPIWRNFQDWQNDFWFQTFGEIDFRSKEGKQRALEVYEEHTKKILQLVPPKQLLLFRVEEGWEPLCKFLEVPRPGVDFPRVNDRAEFKTKILSLMYLGQYGGCVILLGLLVYFLVKLIFAF